MNNQVEEIKQRISLVDYIGRSIGLKRAGRLYKGFCPFHDDRQTPSLTIYPETHSYYCFGCAAAGDLFDWVQQMEGLDFKAALKKFSDVKVELEPPKDFVSKPRIPLRKGEIPVQLARYWHAQLNDRRTYFYGRGFNDTTIDRELFGWSGHRFVIPVWQDEPQRSPLVQVRLRKSPDDESDLPKYLNLSGYSGPHLYNSWVLRGSAEAIIFFGEFDAALAYQHGLPAVSPTNGMLSWNPEWTEEFLKYKEQVRIMPDRGEEERGWRLAAEIHAKAKVLEYPDFGGGKDFTDFILAGYCAKDIFDFVKGG